MPAESVDAVTSNFEGRICPQSLTNGQSRSESGTNQDQIAQSSYTFGSFLISFGDAWEVRGQGGGGVESSSSDLETRICTPD